MVKKTLFLAFFIFTIQLLQAQEKKGKPFFTGSLQFTLAANENYVCCGNDDGEGFFKASAIFLRLGAGYQFNRFLAASIHAGYDTHDQYAIDAFPTYGTLHVNLTEDEGDTFFTEMSYGKMWRPNSSYSDGNYYGLGIGWQIKSENSRWNPVLRLDFHRKKIPGFNDNGNLDSLSIGVGFSFF